MVELANRLLPALHAGVPPTTSFRTDGHLSVREVPALLPALVQAVRQALTHEGSIGVVTAGQHAEALTAALWNAGLDITTPDTTEPGGRARVTVVPAHLAKGLEYDHVIVAEPADLAETVRGLNHLYVALTRAVSRLDVLHTRPLPSPLTP